MNEDRVIIREVIGNSDLAMLHHAWRNALWYADINNRDKEPTQAFKTATSDNINALLDMKDAEIRIACLESDKDMIIGCSALTGLGSNIEFVYVKFHYRNQGVARLLTRGFETISPPITKQGKRVAERLRLKEKPNGRAEETKTQAGTQETLNT